MTDRDRINDLVARMEYVEHTLQRMADARIAELQSKLSAAQGVRSSLRPSAERERTRRAVLLTILPWVLAGIGTAAALVGGLLAAL